MGGATRFLMLLSPPPPLLRHHRCPSLLRLTRHHHYPHRRGRTTPSRANLSHQKHQNLSLSPPVISSFFPVKSSSHQLHTQTSFTAAAASESRPRAPHGHHEWPEWSALLDSLSAGGYFNLPPNFDAYNDEFLAIVHNFPEELLPPACACLAFARDRPNLLGVLPRRDIEVLVENGKPFLFKNANDSARRMSLFLQGGVNSVLDADKANMVDLMRFLLSYVINLAPSEANNLYNKELVESSVRNLLSELAKLSYGIPESNLSGSVHSQFPDRYGQTPRSFGQKIEMKRGDWICPRCNFMNFARNVKCLECEEARPKRQLTGGEWECPQCDFFNYGRNTVCLRCDCKRPGHVSLGTANSRLGLGFGSGSYANQVDLDRRLADNEEKAQRWFSKVSQLDSNSDMSSAIADEDFPEIMPLRKGVNRFVVSTRKTPLERRLANAQYQRNLGNDGTSAGSDLQMGGANKNLDTKISRSLDEILGRSSTSSVSDNSVAASQENAVADRTPPISGSNSQQYGSPQGSNANYVPFVPLPADMFAKKPENSKMEEAGKGKSVSDNYQSFTYNTSEQTGAVSGTGSYKHDNNQSVTSNSSEQTGAVSGTGSNEYNVSGDGLQLSERQVNQNEDNDKEKQEEVKSERWFKRVAELHNVTDLAGAISDEDFPEIMPVRKGENRFVVSKKKDRSLTSPAYKRQMAMEQAGNSNFVPFVPFPPDYFAKKEKQQPEVADSTSKPLGETSNSATSGKLSDDQHRVPNIDGMQQNTSGSRNSGPSGDNLNQSTANVAYRAQTSGKSNLRSSNPQTSSNSSWSSGYSEKGSTNDMTTSTERTSSKSGWSSGYAQSENIQDMSNFSSSSPQPSETQNVRSGWSGKSLEGSAVKEPDPLDMSEEAKAERWFRRVAQIKDISELSQIPDEDFPSIMPMRKGVNRFVVSKRKTPLERRLTSQQYRRNLPIVSSDPVKKENDSS